MTDTKGKNFVEFHKWCVVEEGENRYFHSRDEYETAKAGWKAALEWVMDTRYKDTDVPVYNLIIEELRGDRK